MEGAREVTRGGRAGRTARGGRDEPGCTGRAAPLVRQGAAGKATGREARATGRGAAAAMCVVRDGRRRTRVNS